MSDESPTDLGMASREFGDFVYCDRNAKGTR
jgi:hypothetical protein